MSKESITYMYDYILGIEEARVEEDGDVEEDFEKFDDSFDHDNDAEQEEDMDVNMDVSILYGLYLVVSQLSWFLSPSGHRPAGLYIGLVSVVWFSASVLLCVCLLTFVLNIFFSETTHPEIFLPWSSSEFLKRI